MVVVTYDGKTHRATRAVREKAGWDLAIIEIADNLGGRVATLTQDIAPGDALLMAGSMDGEEFTLSYIRLSKIVPNGVVGAEPHQMFIATGVVWFGNSGGGAFDEHGNLVGIFSKIRLTVETSAHEKVVAGGPLWGWFVGPATVGAFMEQKP
jgi:hypothetical protein